MEPLRNAAYDSVLRGCGFGALAIFCFLVGLSYDVLAMLRGGGVLTMLMALILWLKAYNAPRRNYRSTEMWLYVKPNDRPAPAYAQMLVGAVLKEAYTRAAIFAIAVAVAFWGLAIVLMIGRHLGLVLPATAP